MNNSLTNDVYLYKYISLKLGAEGFEQTINYEFVTKDRLEEFADEWEEMSQLQASFNYLEEKQ